MRGDTKAPWSLQLLGPYCFFAALSSFFVSLSFCLIFRLDFGFLFPNCEDDFFEFLPKLLDKGGGCGTIGAFTFIPLEATLSLLFGVGIAGRIISSLYSFIFSSAIAFAGAISNAAFGLLFGFFLILIFTFLGTTESRGVLFFSRVLC